MNSLNKDIMITLLAQRQSIYQLEKEVSKLNSDSNYATVWRRILKMEKEGLLKTFKGSRKNGKSDQRKTKMPELTPKGLATLLIEGDLKTEELETVSKETLKKDWSNLPTTFLGDTNVDKIFSNTLLKMRYRINLKFFNEVYFDQIFAVSFAESIVENFPKFRNKKRAKDIKETQKIKEKYVSPQTIENLENLKKVFRKEKEKFTHYSNLMTSTISSLRKLGK